MNYIHEKWKQDEARREALKKEYEVVEHFCPHCNPCIGLDHPKCRRRFVTRLQTGAEVVA